MPLTISAERWLEEACCKHGSIPSPAFLHAWVCTADQSWITAVSRAHSTRADATDVWFKEYDGGLWPKARPLSYCGSGIPRENVHEGSRWADVERSKQKQVCFTKLGKMNTYVIISLLVALAGRLSREQRKKPLYSRLLIYNPMVYAYISFEIVTTHLDFQNYANSVNCCQICLFINLMRLPCC